MCHSDFTKDKQVDESRQSTQHIIFPPELMVREINILLNHLLHEASSSRRLFYATIHSQTIHNGKNKYNK